MRIKLEQLSQQLQQHSATLYVLFGNEPLLIQEAADSIRTHAQREGYTERVVLSADQHFDWSALLTAGSNLSLFSKRRIIDLRIPSGKPGKEGGKSLEAFCTALPADTLTLVTLPRIDKQGQASKWFKTLEACGVVIPVYAIERQQLPQWIEQRLSHQQQTTDPPALQFFADRVEGNLLAAHHEIQKLALLYPSGHLTLEQIKTAVLDVARYDAFQLADAMLAADAARYARILNGLQGEGTPPLVILATLTEQIRQLIHLHQGLARGQAAAQLLQAVRVWGDRQKLVMTAVRSLSLPRLSRGISKAAAIDRIIKGVELGDAWEALLQLGLYLTLHSRNYHGFTR